jgi:hypothetical protein
VELSLRVELAFAAGPEFARQLPKWRSVMVMHQIETSARSKHARIDYRSSRRSRYEIPYLMMLGNLSYGEAADLISRHDGDRHAINAELVARRRKPAD